MKKKYIFGGAVIALFMTVMIYLFTQSSIQYEENFQTIKNSGKSFRATGAWVKDKGCKYDKDSDTFSFVLEDAHGNELKVIYSGSMPNNFETGTSVVATGRYDNGVFHAREILTKCPSKYEGKYNDVKQMKS